MNAGRRGNVEIATETCSTFSVKDISGHESEFVIGEYNENGLFQEIHAHSFIQIYYIIEGKLKHIVNDESCYLSKGDFFMVPPDVYHRIEPTNIRRLKYVSIGFVPGFVECGMNPNVHIRLRPKICFAGDALVRAERIVMDMLKEFAEKKDGYLVYNKGMLLQLLVLTAREYMTAASYYIERIAGWNGNGYGYSDAIFDCVEYVHEHFAQQLTIDEVAKKFFLSRTYFCKWFKHCTGKSFNAYLNDVRIACSKKLLDSPKYTITDIAYESGFNDVSSFCRKFKEQFGISPSAYRKIRMHSGGGASGRRTLH